jgi:hypothetical protein
VGARRVIVAVVAAALGLWVAIAAAQGGLGGASSGTGTATGTGFPCPSTPVGSTTREVCPPEPGVGHGSGGGSGAGGQPGAGGQGQSTGGQGSEGAETVVHHGRRFAGRRLTFTFSVRLHHAPGAAAVQVSGYSAQVSPPRGSPASCQPQLTRLVALTQKDQVARVRVKPPLGGWCGGRYHVTVSLNHGP